MICVSLRWLPEISLVAHVISALILGYKDSVLLRILQIGPDGLIPYTTYHVLYTMHYTIYQYIYIYLIYTHTIFYSHRDPRITSKVSTACGSFGPTTKCFVPRGPLAPNMGPYRLYRALKYGPLFVSGSTILNYIGARIS